MEAASLPNHFSKSLTRPLLSTRPINPEYAQVAYVYAQLLDRPVPMYGLGMVK